MFSAPRNIPEAHAKSTPVSSYPLWVFVVTGYGRSPLRAENLATPDVMTIVYSVLNGPPSRLLNVMSTETVNPIERRFIEEMTPMALRNPVLASPFRVMDEALRSWGGNRVTGFTPLLDVRETDDEYLVLVDLPGVKSEDVSVEVNQRVLSISGSRAPVETGEAQLVERPYGSFVRTLTLPKGVDESKIVADYHDGTLELHVPKRVETRPKKIAIASGSHKAIGK
jgi:HSP20 family protein